MWSVNQHHIYMNIYLVGYLLQGCLPSLPGPTQPPVRRSHQPSSPSPSCWSFPSPPPPPHCPHCCPSTCPPPPPPRLIVPFSFSPYPSSYPTAPMPIMTLFGPFSPLSYQLTPSHPPLPPPPPPPPLARVDRPQDVPLCDTCPGNQHLWNTPLNCFCCCCKKCFSNINLISANIKKDRWKLSSSCGSSRVIWPPSL